MKNPFEDGQVVRRTRGVCHVSTRDFASAMLNKCSLRCLRCAHQVGITNYVDVGLRLAAPLARERAAAAGGGACLRSRADVDVGMRLNRQLT